MTFALRRAVPTDVGAIATIWHAGWVDGHVGRVAQGLVDVRTEASFVERAPRRLSQTTVAVTGPPTFAEQRVAGFVMVADDEVEQLYVAAAHRGSGCAALLLHAAETQIAAAGDPVAWLAVVAGNERARRFYTKRGWTDTGAFTYLAIGEAGSEIPVPARRYEKRVERHSVGRRWAPKATCPATSNETSTATADPTIRRR